MRGGWQAADPVMGQAAHPMNSPEDSKSGPPGTIPVLNFSPQDNVSYGMGEKRIVGRPKAI